ncbi:MAG TPA: Asp23/Gls24 family envelope stress response protein [Candidatus Limnocylindrales bacterium]|nr:Asp23/Gls24 family envelope stress response protein [Candidatus Limnocylindrales bacterium]
MPTDRSVSGRSIATRRAIVDVVRAAVLGSYGVTAVGRDRPVERLLVALRVRSPGIRVRLDRGLEVDLDLVVAFGLPVAEVARQVDSAVRYAVGRAFDQDVRRLTIHVGGLRYQPASVPPVKAHERLGDASSLAGGDGRTPDGTADPVATGERG